MVRKIATQVPASMSRLIKSTLVKTPPVWYEPVLANPPPILPARQVTARNRPEAGKQYTDLPPKSARRANLTGTHHHVSQFRSPKLKPQPIVYPVDRVRRQFFADFPFEALRPVSLVEGRDIVADHPVRGAEWKELVQRGAYPTVEDTIEFVVHLNETAGLSMSDAYAEAVKQFVHLRAAHEMATLAAATEARHNGVTYKRDEWTRTFEIQEQILDHTAHGTVAGEVAPSAYRHRRPRVWVTDVADERIPRGEFTGGREYAQKWRLPAPVESEVAAEGDLVSAIGTGSIGEAAAGGAKVEDASELDAMMDLLSDGR